VRFLRLCVAMLRCWLTVRPARELDIASGMSSPLTSLSSLEDIDEGSSVFVEHPPHDAEDLKVAQASSFTYAPSHSF